MYMYGKCVNIVTSMYVQIRMYICIQLCMCTCMAWHFVGAYSCNLSKYRFIQCFYGYLGPQWLKCTYMYI